MRIMRLKTVYCLPRTTVSDPAKYKYPYLLRNLRIDRPNQVWLLDINCIPMPRGFMYLLGIMDVYSRFIVGWSLSNTMESEWVVNTLKTSLAEYGKPEIINSVQGSQFTSDEYVNFVKGLETVKISMDGKERAVDNVYIERFFRTKNIIKFTWSDRKQETNCTRLANILLTTTTKDGIILPLGMCRQ